MTDPDAPCHLAIIMDGNRRYAKEVLHTPAFEGHRLGKKKLQEVMHWCVDLGIKHLTVYGFSLENFGRGEDEIECIMDLLEKSLYEFADDPEVHEKQVSIRMIGDRSMLPSNVLEAMEKAEKATENYHEFYFNLAVAYGGRQEIVNTMREAASKVREGMDINSIDVPFVDSLMSTSRSPDPDLIIRTSGEMRLSNFMLWQMAYSELYFTDVYWPGFSYEDLLEAIDAYKSRKRRFGV